VIEIADELDVRRVDALADANTPAPAAEDLILTAKVRIEAAVVHVLDRERHAAHLEVAFDAVQERDRVVGALLKGHAAALAANSDYGFYPLARDHVDVRAQVLLELVVDLGVNDAVRERDGARTGEQEDHWRSGSWLR